MTLGLLSYLTKIIPFTRIQYLIGKMKKVQLVINFRNFSLDTNGELGVQYLAVKLALALLIRKISYLNLVSRN